MISALLGKKVGMTQVFDPKGERVPVTIVQAGPCVVLQSKTTKTKDGYNAVQLGFEDVKPHRSTLAAIGHARASKTAPKRFIRDVRLGTEPTVNVGDVLRVDLFNEIKFVDVIGITKGKGFQGGMKRWGFGGQSSSHGTERKHRSPGSISSRGAERGRSGAIKKGKKMAGHMGDTQRTSRNLALVGVDTDNNVLLIKGSIPGSNDGYVIVRQSKTRTT